MKSICLLGNFAIVLLLAGDGLAQVAEVSLPRQREVAVQAAVKIWGQRGVIVSVPDPAPNPFQFLVEAPPESESSDVGEVVDVPLITGSELVNRLAARVPASGTFLIGGESYLLLGQKRLKAGDTITISFDGKSYDLLIETINSTTFTVSLGSFKHTRATYISSSTRP